MYNQGVGAEAIYTFLELTLDQVGSRSTLEYFADFSFRSNER